MTCTRIPSMCVLCLFIYACSTQKEAQTAPKAAPLESAYTSDITQTTLKKKDETLVANEPVMHTVQKGESLWVIARKYGVTVKAIATANDIENTGLIKINQKLLIPEKK